MACNVSRTIYVIVQFIAFALVLIGSPIDMFRAKGTDTIGNTGCLSLWGAKQKCYSTAFDARPKTLFAVCDARLKRWQAAEAFAIVSIVVLGVAFAFGLISLCCLNCLRWFCLLLNVVAVITVIIVVAIMADAYNKGMSQLFALTQCGALKQGYKYGAGFGLYIVGWALNLLNIISLLVSC